MFWLERNPRGNGERRSEGLREGGEELILERVTRRREEGGKGEMKGWKRGCKSELGERVRWGTEH